MKRLRHGGSFSDDSIIKTEEIVLQEGTSAGPKAIWMLKRLTKGHKHNHRDTSYHQFERHKVQRDNFLYRAIGGY